MYREDKAVGDNNRARCVAWRDRAVGLKRGVSHDAQRGDDGLWILGAFKKAQSRNVKHQD